MVTFNATYPLNQIMQTDINCATEVQYFSYVLMHFSLLPAILTHVQSIVLSVYRFNCCCCWLLYALRLQILLCNISTMWDISCAIIWLHREHSCILYYVLSSVQFICHLLCLLVFVCLQLYTGALEKRNAHAVAWLNGNKVHFNNKHVLNIDALWQSSVFFFVINSPNHQWTCQVFCLQ